MTIPRRARALPPVLLAAAAALALAAPSAHAEVTTGTRVSVVAIGDSLTDPKSHGGKFLGVLRKQCPDSTFDAAGKGGEMVNQMRKRFVRDVFGTDGDPKPARTHVIVMGGVNDLYSDETAGRTVEKITKDLGAMYAAARGRGVKVVAVTVAPWGGFTRYFTPHRGETTRALNAWIRAQAAEGKVDAVVDASVLLACDDPDRLCPDFGMKDGLHWTTKGHERLGRALADGPFAGCR